MDFEKNSKPADVRRKAMDLLARREHSYLELARKLRQRQFPDDLIFPELDKLQQENLLSEQRFTQSYINMRTNNGFGPVRIADELRQRGISDDLINTYITESDTIWAEQAMKVQQKRFGDEPPVVFTERVKQAKFLNYRGFNQQHIDTVLGSE